MKNSIELKANIEAVTNHIFNGCPEANDDLNTSNINLIKAYAKKHPEAICLKINDKNGIFKPSERKLYNFCCNYIFNGAKIDIEIIKNLVEQWQQTSELKYLKAIEEELEKIEAICFIWS